MWYEIESSCAIFSFRKIKKVKVFCQNLYGLVTDNSCSKDLEKIVGVAERDRMIICTFNLFYRYRLQRDLTKVLYLATFYPRLILGVTQKLYEKFNCSACAREAGFLVRIHRNEIF